MYDNTVWLCYLKSRHATAWCVDQMPIVFEFAAMVKFLYIFVLIELSFAIKQAPAIEYSNFEPIVEPEEVSQSKEAGILLWLTFSILIAVIIMSAVLSFKLWKLEKELSVEPIPDYESLR